MDFQGQEANEVLKDLQDFLDHEEKLEKEAFQDPL